MTVPDEAVVLAGGLGTRLRGVVSGVPKPLAMVAGRPFLAWLLDSLATQGLRRVVLATGYLGEQVEAEIGANWLGMQLVYSRELVPLGTGGAIVQALREVFGNAFLVLNGDSWLELDYSAFCQTSANSGARLGVALADVPDVMRYGAAVLRGDVVTGFREKGSSGAGLINAGVYWVQRSLLDGYPVGSAFSFEREVLIPAVSGELVVGYSHTRNFIDIGLPEDFRRAQVIFDPARTTAP